MAHANERVLDDLRARIARIEHAGRPDRGVVPFGVREVDARLLQGGLARGALHELGGGLGSVHGAKAVLFAPALAGAGLHPDRVIHAEASDEQTMLLCLDEGLRHGGLAGVVGETSRLSMTASRRLQLAAEASGVTAFAIRHWRNAAAVADI